MSNAEQRRAYRRTPKGAAVNRRAVRLAQTFFTEELYERCLEYQSGRCAVCRQEATLCRDHDHAARRPRGLLCQACNISLGYYEKRQRKTLVIEPYEAYLASPPADLCRT